MARKKLIEAVETKTAKNNLQRLEALVKTWGSNKTQADALKKDVDKDAAEIKQLMMEENLSESVSGDFIEKLSYQTKITFDEDGLVEYIRKHIWTSKKKAPCPYLKTIIAIDWDALENAIYNEELTEEQILAIDKFKSETKTPVLKLGKPKKEK